MKTFITLAVVCLIASVLATPVELNEDQKAKAKVHFEECIKQENITEEEATKLRNKDFANPSHNLKCFGTCFFEKVGTLKDSVIQEDVVLKTLGSIIGEEKTKKALDKCRDIKGEDRCDTGFQLYQCFEAAKAEMVEA
ncbi:general odorant-binding protein 56a-like [Musca domestica]|uniref:General odorant-binding protein 56a-like n=1 Tax=Musca domestica TaxID=7370 RepID=A0A1I8N8V3_MUSDO|nr:general odorant-binding protein 56a-like [Musca domestica]